MRTLRHFKHTTEYVTNLFRSQVMLGARSCADFKNSARFWNTTVRVQVQYLILQHVTKSPTVHVCILYEIVYLTIEFHVLIHVYIFQYNGERRVIPYHTWDKMWTVGKSMRYANAYLGMVSVGSTEKRRYSICVCVCASKLPLCHIAGMNIQVDYKYLVRRRQRDSIYGTQYACVW